MLLKQMKIECLKPDGRTFVSLLMACANAGALEQGKQIHIDVVNSGYGSDVFVLNALLDMYIKCHSPRDAHEVFGSMNRRDVISFTTIIGGSIKHGDSKEALKLFHQMKREGLKADGLAFVYALNACANLKALEYGKQVHAEILECGLLSDIFVGNALINLYAKCGCLDQARDVLMAIPRRDVISWTTITAGFVKHKKFKEAIELCERMKQEGLKPDKVTFVSLLNACASTAALQEGKQAHADILDAGFEKDIFVSNALIDMYGKCGSLKDARKVFDEMPERDTISWTAMIASYTTHGDGAEAFHLFRLMQHESIEPDEVTFVSVLTGCSHVGLLDEGCSLFESMFIEYKLTPMLEHYGCMIDLFGRSGRLQEAYNYLTTMPLSPDVKLWKALLGACKVHGNLELAESVTAHIFQLQPQESAAYVMLSNMYAAAGRWNEKVNLRQSMDKRGVNKQPAHSIVEREQIL
ncbi:hypothetical protein O6H91_Y009900 [Diphasiastrum complanatum]|nr:hypothetical protein O6H91_Y009900 [Diphasiastrum complanatum]